MYAIPVGLHQVVERGYLFFSNKIRYTTFYFDKFKLTLTIGNVKNIEKEFSLHLEFYSNKKYIKCMPLFLCNIVHNIHAHHFFHQLHLFPWKQFLFGRYFCRLLSGLTMSISLFVCCCLCMIFQKIRIEIQKREKNAIFVLEMQLKIKNSMER